MYAWETPFIKMISEIRAEEVKQIKKSSFIRGYIGSSSLIVERFILFVTLVSLSLMGKTLSAEITFVLATYYNLLQLAISIAIPSNLVNIEESLASLKRVQEFLLLDENDQRELRIQNPHLRDDIFAGKNQELNVKKLLFRENQNKVEIEFFRVCANWVPKQLPPTLCNLGMKIEGGELCAIVGMVGSGKSAILNVLIRELPIGCGTVSIRQKPDSEVKESVHVTGYVVDDPNLCISYASQDAWLFTGTVRDNILFGQPFEEGRYKQVTKVCALLHDFQQFPYGDMSLVGERGVTLSGGQRARINLARAVYKRADLYLLDDPLSAVDTRVGQHLFEKCIVEFLAGKTRILVTHQLQFLEKVDKIVSLDNGSITYQGNYENFIKRNSEFMQMLRKEDENKPSISEESYYLPNLKENFKTNLRHRKLRQLSTLSNISDFVRNEFGNEAEECTEEEMEEGAMKGKIYKQYFRTGGSWFSLAFLAFMTVLTILSNGANDFWTAYWTNADFLKSKAMNGSMSKMEYSRWANSTFMSTFGYEKSGYLTENNFIYIYIFLIGSVIFTNFFRCILFMNNCLKASYSLHNTMFEKITRTTMLFFNRNPSGRILNRFSKDIGVIDELLPQHFLESMDILVVVVGVLTLIAIVNVWMLIPVAVIGIAIFFLNRFFMRTISILKRMEGVTKSPVFSHVNTTFQGLATVRSGGKDVQSMMKKQFDNYQNIHTGTNYLIRATAQCFCLLVDNCINIFIACVSFTLILIKTENVHGDIAGLAISQSMMLTGMVQYGLSTTMEAMMQMTAVERVLQYTKLPKESPLETSDPLPPNWPSAGRVVFRDVFMRYKVEEPPVLKNLNVTIEPGWKVGVCGRTGAGKSSLIAALFRLCSADCLEGSITIDERDTASVGLGDLRSRISIIPQEPVLFSKSLRYNLDPFNAFSDSALYEAVKEVELNDVSLDQQVSEGGSNFSVGQRQLICLARAILRNNRILVLDEATANIDNHTDALIQKTIRKKFADCTVLTVAHRLNTIIDSDRILVMDNGQLVEFDTPGNLLSQNGYFSKMINKLGPAISQELTQLARTSQSKISHYDFERKPEIPSTLIQRSTKL